MCNAKDRTKYMLKTQRGGMQKMTRHISMTDMSTLILTRCLRENINPTNYHNNEKYIIIIE
jgi:hypothetical protein